MSDMHVERAELVRAVALARGSDSELLRYLDRAGWIHPTEARIHFRRLEQAGVDREQARAELAQVKAELARTRARLRLKKEN